MEKSEAKEENLKNGLSKNLGKILFALIIITFLIGISIVLSAIFSRDTNIDMFIVWLIFTAEEIKKLFTGSWNTAVYFCGTIMLIIWFIYYMIRLLTLKDSLVVDGDELLSNWDKENENIYQQYGKVLWKIGVTFWLISFAMDLASVGIPTAKQSAVIYVVPKIMNNVDIQEIPPNLAKLVNEGLKEMITAVQIGGTEITKEAIEASKKATTKTVQETVEKVKDEIKGDE